MQPFLEVETRTTNNDELLPYTLLNRHILLTFTIYMMILDNLQIIFVVFVPGLYIWQCLVHNVIYNNNYISWITQEYQKKCQDNPIGCSFDKTQSSKYTSTATIYLYYSYCMYLIVIVWYYDLGTRRQLSDFIVVTVFISTTGMGG